MTLKTGQEETKNSPDTTFVNNLMCVNLAVLFSTATRRIEWHLFIYNVISQNECGGQIKVNQVGNNVFQIDAFSFKFLLTKNSTRLFTN